VHLVGADRVRIQGGTDLLEVSRAAPVISIDKQDDNACFARSICNAIRQRNLAHEKTPESGKKDAELLKTLAEELRRKKLKGGGDQQIVEAERLLANREIPFRRSEKTDELIAHLKRGGTAVLLYHQNPIKPWDMKKTRNVEHLPARQFSLLPFPSFRNTLTSSTVSVAPPVPGDGLSHASLAVGVIERPGSPERIVALNSQSGWFDILSSQIFREAETFTGEKRAFRVDASPTATFLLIDPK
jgi:hypothetical protein